MNKKIFFASSAIVMLTSCLTACSNKSEGSKEGKTEIVAKEELAAGEGHTTPMAAYIRYVDTQRILQEYALAHEVSHADSTAQIQLASLQQQLAGTLQKRAKDFQDKLDRGGFINQQAAEAEAAKIQKAQQDAENRMAQRQRDYSMDIMAKQQELDDSIKSVVKDYCVANKLDAVLNAAAGLYFNPALDVTDDIIAELNRRYKSAK